MMRILSAIAFGAVLGVVGMSFAGRDHEKGASVAKPIFEGDIAEKLDGREARATVVELNIDPGAAGVPHRHPGPVIGYVLEGEYEWAIDDKPAKTLKVGAVFYEPTGSLHRVSRNPDAKNRTRVIAVVLHPRDAKQIALPEPAAKKE